MTSSDRGAPRRTELGAVLRERGALGADAARAVLSRICDAVGDLHDTGSVHGELSPSAIFVTLRAGDTTPLDVEVKAGEPADPSWKAPERMDPRRAPAPSADVWSLGLLAFALFTGRPFGRPGEGLPDPMPRASKRAEELGAAGLLPDGFDGWFAQCVARDPALRYRDAREVGSSFEALTAPPEHQIFATIPAPPRSLQLYGHEPLRAPEAIGPVPTSDSPRSRRDMASEMPGPQTILVIDDDPMALLVVRHHLKRSGYVTVTASTGEEGIARARGVLPTLILLDFHLPDIDGPEVLQRLRADDTLRDVPVILLTATEQASDIAAGFRAGANDYLMKPVDTNLLSARIEAAVSARAKVRRADKIVVRHQKLVADLEEARAEQEVTLSVLPASWRGWWAVGGVAPSGLVGGDLIAIYAGLGSGGDERTAVVVDVAGHGAGAALVGASVRAALRLLLKRHELVDAVAALNEELTSGAASRHACLAAVQVQGSNVTVVNAGLPPVCVVRGGELILEVASSGVPPGLVADQTYASTSFIAEPGDRIAVVSDGLVEPFGHFDDAMPILNELGAFDPSRWNGGEQPADVAELLRDTLGRLAGPQPDDATLLLLQAGR